MRKTLRYSNEVFHVVPVGKSQEKWIFFLQIFKKGENFHQKETVKVVKMFFSFHHRTNLRSLRQAQVRIFNKGMQLKIEKE